MQGQYLQFELYFKRINEIFGLYAQRLMVMGNVEYVPCLLFEDEDSYLAFEIKRVELEKTFSVSPERETNSKGGRIHVCWPNCHLEAKDMDLMISGLFDKMGWTLRPKS